MIDGSGDRLASEIVRLARHERASRSVSSTASSPDSRRPGHHHGCSSPATQPIIVLRPAGDQGRAALRTCRPTCGSRLPRNHAGDTERGLTTSRDGEGTQRHVHIACRSTGRERDRRRRNPGLTTGEARRRRTADGPNVLPTPRPPSPVLLLAAAADALLRPDAVGGGRAGARRRHAAAGRRDRGRGAVNGVFAFVQEYRADRAGRAAAASCCRCAPRCVRDGRRAGVDAAELVVGDLVLLEAGDRICADLRAASDAHGLGGRRVDADRRERAGAPRRRGRASTPGTFVVEGEAAGRRRRRPARRTRLAAIAALTRARPSARPARWPSSCSQVVRVDRRRSRSASASPFFGVALLLGMRPTDGLPVRRRRHRRAGPGGPAADRHALAGPGRPADGRPQRAGPPAGIGRDARLDHVHLHRQDRHADPQRDGGRRGVDPGRRRVRRTAPATSPTARSRRTRRPWRGARSSRPRPRAARRAARSARTGTGRRSATRWRPRCDVLALRAGLDLRADEAADPSAGVSRSTRGAGAVVVVGRRRRPRTGQGRAGRGAAAVRRRRRRRRADGGRGRAWRAQGLRVLAVAAGPRRPARDRDSAAEAWSSELELLGLVGLQDPPARRRRRGDRALPQRRHPARHDHRRPSRHRARPSPREVGLLGRTARCSTAPTCPPTTSALGALLDRDGVVVARVTPGGQAAHRPGPAAPAATSWP